MPLTLLSTDELVHVLRYTSSAADLFQCLRTCQALAQAVADDRCWVGLGGNGARKQEDRHGRVDVESQFGSHRERVCYRLALRGVRRAQNQTSSIVMDILGQQAWLGLTAQIFKGLLERPRFDDDWRSIQCPADFIRTFLEPTSSIDEQHSRRYHIRLRLGAAASGMLQTIVEDDVIRFMEKGALCAIHRTTGTAASAASQSSPVEPPSTTLNEMDARVAAAIADDRGHLFNSHADVPMNLELMRRLARRAGVVKITHGALVLYWNRLVGTVAYLTVHAVVRLLELSKKEAPEDDDDGASHASDEDEDESESESDDANSSGWSSEDEEVSENEQWIHKASIDSDDDLATMIQKQLTTIYSPPEAFIVAAAEQLQRDNSAYGQRCYGRSTVAHSDATAAATDGWRRDGPPSPRDPNALVPESDSDDA
jgi:hypothetical protein